jgi:hypothetical protein
MTDYLKELTIDNFWDVVKSNIENIHNSGGSPLIVIDLDGTLVDYSIRTYSIFQEIPHKFELPDDIKEKLLSIKPTEFKYHPRENLIALDLNNDELVEKLSKFWEKCFLSNYYLDYDMPFDGVDEFIQNVLSLDMNIVYLTGRDEENMGMGTRAWLKKYKLHPIENRTRLILKTDMDLINYQSKVKGCHMINKLGTPVMLIDNEPKELISIWECFPEAIGILMQTQNSGRPAILPDNTFRIDSFVELNSRFTKQKP